MNAGMSVHFVPLRSTAFLTSMHAQRPLRHLLFCPQATMVVFVFHTIRFFARTNLENLYITLAVVPHDRRGSRTWRPDLPHPPPRRSIVSSFRKLARAAIAARRNHGTDLPQASGFTAPRTDLRTQNSAIFPLQHRTRTQPAKGGTEPDSADASGGSSFTC